MGLKLWKGDLKLHLANTTTIVFALENRHETSWNSEVLLFAADGKTSSFFRSHPSLHQVSPQFPCGIGSPVFGWASCLIATHQLAQVEFCHGSDVEQNLGQTGQTYVCLNEFEVKPMHQKLCRCIESRRWEQGPHSHPFLLGWPFKLGSSNNPLVVHALKCPDLPKISASPIKDWISSFPSIPNQALCRSPSRFHLTQVGHHGLLPTDAPNWKLENGPGSSQQWAAANQAKGSNVKRCKSYII